MFVRVAAAAWLLLLQLACCARLTAASVTMRLIGSLRLFCATNAAAAQEGETRDGLSFPERAMALHPTGATVLRGSWVRAFPPSATEWDDDEFIHSDFTVQEIEARIPIGAVLLEGAFGSSQQIFSRSVDPDRFVVLYPSSPQLGAYYIAAPAPGWRVELGGALAIGIHESEVIDSACYGTPMYCLSPQPPGPTGEETLGWNAYRRTLDAVVAIPRARVEWDPVPDLALGAEIEIPIYVFHERGEVNAFPQGMIEVAVRGWSAILVGARTQLTSYFTERWRTDRRHELNVTLEPFVRGMLFERAVGGFVEASALFSMGPAYPLIGNPLHSSYFSGGYFGAQLELGVSY